MMVDKELFASMREGAVGEIVREIEDKAEAKGKAEGEAQNEVKGVLRIVDRRGIVLTAEQRARILGCADLQVLNRWFDEAIDAKSADEIFA